MWGWLEHFRVSYNSTVRSGEKLMTLIWCKRWEKTIKIDVLELTMNELHKLTDLLVQAYT